MINWHKNTYFSQNKAHSHTILEKALHVQIFNIIAESANCGVSAVFVEQFLSANDLQPK